VNCRLQTIKDNEEKLAEQSQKGRQMRAALKAQEKQILAAASGGGVIQLPAAAHSRVDSARSGTVSRDDHERELERVRREMLSEQEALRENHTSSLQRLERQWEIRFESREAEMEAARCASVSSCVSPFILGARAHATIR
jgi:hypothetical protein